MLLLVIGNASKLYHHDLACNAFTISFFRQYLNILIIMTIILECNAPKIQILTEPICKIASSMHINIILSS